MEREVEGRSRCAGAAPLQSVHELLVEHTLVGGMLIDEESPSSCSKPM